MKCQNLFSGKNKKIVTKISFAEYAHRVVNLIIPNLSNSSHNFLLSRK